MSFLHVCGRKKWSNQIKNLNENGTALQERVLGGSNLCFPSKRMNVSPFIAFLHLTSQPDSKSGADSSDIPSTNTSDNDVTSGSIGSPVQENVVAVNADYVLEPTTQKHTKTQETLTTIIDAFALFVLCCILLGV